MTQVPIKRKDESNKILKPSTILLKKKKHVSRFNIKNSPIFQNRRYIELNWSFRYKYCTIRECLLWNFNYVILVCVFVYRQRKLYTAILNETTRHNMIKTNVESIDSFFPTTKYKYRQNNILKTLLKKKWKIAIIIVDKTLFMA